MLRPCLCSLLIIALLQSVMNLPTTVLDQELQIPWQETFYLRCGVDALTGDPKYSALKQFTVRDNILIPDRKKQDTVVVEIIHGVHQQLRKQSQKFEVQGTVNPMSASALNSSFAIQTSHVSPDDSFLVETIVSGEYDFEYLDLDDLKLASKAKASSKTPRKFRNIYGDYFIIGFKRRYWFHALVECR